MSDLKVEVGGSLKINNEKMGRALDEIRSRGGTKAITDNQYFKAKEDLRFIDKLASQSNLTQEELRSLGQAFKRVSDTIKNSAAKITNLTKEAQELAAVLEKAKNAQNANAAKKTENQRKQKPALERYKSALSGYYLVGTDSKGNETSKKITSRDTAEKRGLLTPGGQLKTSTKIIDDQGNEADASIRKEINAALRQYKEAVIAVKEAEDIEDKLLQERNEAQRAFNAKLFEDRDNGLTKDTDIIAGVENATMAVHDDIAGLKADYDTQKTNIELQEMEADLSGLSDSAKKAGNSIGKLAKQFSIWTIGLRIAKKAMHEVKATIVDLDKSLTEQAMVTGKSRKEVYNLLTSYQDLALQIGSTTKEVSAAVTEFIRQGKSTQESLELAKAAISAAKVAAINTSDSINYLTTALNGFQLSTNQAMLVSDKFAAISANAATSYEEIAIALSKVAAQANLAGMSIDYTTALLAKGLETTREAPETIGTALKTIIARMREIDDYGATLEDGVDLNNVESQLAYVGIRLKTTSGELRSTEDVLDDLGKKWDSLNSNQQAAIAKALAGTRQQSRLIAMMNDYERVIELQEISARSAGATTAQMSVYVEGLEAALNKLSTSWEKIVSTVTNSDVIVFIIDSATAILTSVNDILSQTWGMVGALTLLTALAGRFLSRKVQEHNMNLLITKEQTKQKIAQLQAFKEYKKTVTLQQLGLKIQNKKTRLAEIETEITAVRKRLEAGDLSAQSELIKLEVERASVAKDISALEFEIKSTSKDIEIIDSQITADTESLKNLSGNIVTNIATMLPGAMALYTIMKGMVLVLRKIGAIQKKNAADKVALSHATAAADAQAIAAGGATGGMPGLAIAAAIIAALGLASVGIYAALKAAGAFDSQAQKDAKAIDELSNQLYIMTKRSEAISTVITTIEDLDSNLIKTKEDAEALTEALAGIADSLSGDVEDNLMNVGNISEQEFYKNLTEAEQTQFLKDYYDLLNTLQYNKDRELSQVLARTDFSTNSNARLSARSEAKRTAYRVLDNSNLTSTEAKNRRVMLESIIESASDDTLKKIMFNDEQMAKILERLSSIKIEDGSIASDVLIDKDATLEDRTEAFEALKDALVDMPDVLEAIGQAYNEFKIFSAMDDAVLRLINNLDITNEELNDLYKSYNTIANTLKNNGYGTLFSDLLSESDYQDKLMNELLPQLTRNNQNFADAVKTAFGDVLEGLTADEYEEVYSAILNQIANAIAVGILNIGQNVDKLQNTISSIYSTAQKWSGMSSTEQSEFLSENQELFSGEDGAALLSAFSTNDYQAIKQALANNKTLQDNIAGEIEEVEKELNLEMSRIGDDRNEALIQYLKERLAMLKSSDFLSIDLETLVEQENARIEAYKELLQKEEDALTDSLTARKDAYQKYFDAINQEAEDEDYEEEAELLIGNLTKLAGSNNATSKAQIEELENSLAELEKERLQTLRERAQEAVMNSIEDTINDISEKFDELLENNREILNLLNKTSGNELVAGLLSQESFAGKTANEAQQYLNEIQSTFGSQVSNIDWSNISTSVDNGGNLILNIGDKVIQLSGNGVQGSNIREQIEAALEQNGINAGL